MGAPTQRAEIIFEAAAPLLRKEATGRAFRLIGVGIADLTVEAGSDMHDLFAGTPDGETV
jgi:DNA polymerase-4